MPAILANATNFLYNSDYPLDKVVYLASGSLGAVSGSNYTVAHGLPFIPLVDLEWSYTSDFAVSYASNMGDFPSSNPAYLFKMRLTLSADATNVTIYADGSNSPVAIYYRIFGFQPDDSDKAVASTVSSGDALALSTDYNYTKLYMAGHVAIGTGGTATITHNLGYYPQVQVWASSGGTTQLVDFSGDNDYHIIEITTTALIITLPSLSSGTYYYRIYADT